MRSRSRQLVGAVTCRTRHRTAPIVQLATWERSVKPMGLVQATKSLLSCGFRPRRTRISGQAAGLYCRITLQHSNNHVSRTRIEYELLLVLAVVGVGAHIVSRGPAKRIAETRDVLPGSRYAPTWRV